MKNKLHGYLDKSITPYHTVNYCCDKLTDGGFKELKMNTRFEITDGGKYFVRPFPTMLVAFIMPEKVGRIHIATAHTDYPTFKLKPVYEMTPSQNLQRINVEPYGGSLKRTWFDRPLGIAGQVIVKGRELLHPETMLFDTEKPVAVIPSLAPHMDRDIEKKEIEPAREMNPVVSLDGSSLQIIDMISSTLSVNKEDILGMDLYLYDTEKAVSVGINDEFISSGKIDNIASVAAINEAMLGASISNDTLSIAVYFDNEEVGSRTKQGADSDILNLVIRKILIDSSLISNESELISILSESSMLSVDGAHAVHPGYPDKADTTSVAHMGKGFVLKTSASQRYVCDPVLSGIIKDICREEKIPYQVQANKSGTPGGQTLGPLLSSYIPVRAVDMGVPMLAMHSVREMTTYQDYEALLHIIQKFMSL